MGKENIKVVAGMVTEALPNASFRVKLSETNEEVLAHLSGKMRMYRIKVVVGDTVQMEVSLDGARGRITRRS
ncbi:translation initiation factor IF-1 [Patescibacteria group bacterium]|nr:translation initiation factor IF-1 [Patescibacteria group bacterium]